MTIATIETLRDISQRCQDVRPLSREQNQWLGRALDDFLSHRCPSIDAAMHLCFPRGGIPWWREEANRKRDAALRAMAEAVFADLSVTAQARHIRMLTVRYAATAWLIDRRLTAMPVQYIGGLKEFLYRAFACGASLPVSERTLRCILQR